MKKTNKHLFLSSFIILVVIWKLFGVLEAGISAGDGFLKSEETIF